MQLPPSLECRQIPLCDVDWPQPDWELQPDGQTTAVLSNSFLPARRSSVASLQFVALCLATLVASMASIAAISIAMLGDGIPAAEFLRIFLGFCGIIWGFVALNLLTQAIDWANRRGSAVTAYVPAEHVDSLSSLGAPTAIHRLHRACAQCLLVMGSFLCILGSILIAMSVTLGPVSMRGLCVGALASFAGLWMFVYLIRRWSVALVACSGGFIKIERGEVELWPWEEIATIHLRYCYEEKHCEYLVARQDGAKLSFDENYEYSCNHLGVRLQHAVCHSHLRELLLMVSEGRMAVFGPIQVGADGILAGSQWAPWGDEVSLERNGDFLTIRRHGRRVWRERVERIPNLALLLSLAEQLHTLRATSDNSYLQVK
jgi:hypothetical protein